MPPAPSEPPQIGSLGRGAALRASFDWVFDAILDKEPDLSLCPSRGAYAMLKWAKNNDNEFYKYTFALLGKEKTDGAGTLERKSKTHFDKVAEQADRLISQVLQNGPEGNGGESLFSPDDLEEGDDEPGDEADAS